MMKRFLCCIAILFSMSACSFNDVVALLVTPTIPPPPVDTSTPTIVTTPSQTPTISPVPSFTSTPTKSGLGGSFEDPTGTVEPLPTLILIPTATPGPQVSLNSAPGSLILSISVSNEILYWGYCDAPKYIDFDVRLANNIRVTYVLLFLRLVDKSGMQSTPWGVGAIMEEVNGSLYTYRIPPSKLDHYNEFKDAWIQYQVVVTTRGLEDLARSPVYRQELTLRYCAPVDADE